MQPSTKKTLQRAALGALLVVAALAAGAWGMRMDAVSRSHEARKIAQDYSEQTHATQAAALKAAAQFQVCQTQALQSKENGETDPAAKFFDCFAPGVIKGDGSLTGPFLLFGAAMMDPAAEEKAPQRAKILADAYAQANKTFELEAKKALEFDKRMDDACNGWWARQVCALAVPKAGEADERGRWKPTRKAPLVSRQMQEVDVALWQANHPAQVREQLLAQSQAAATGDKKTVKAVADRAPWIAPSQDSQKLREGQMAAWAKAMG